jgi:hypothetical protein
MMPSTIIHNLYTTIFIRGTRHTNFRVNFYLQPSRGLRIVSFHQGSRGPLYPFLFNGSNKSQCCIPPARLLLLSRFFARFKVCYPLYRFIFDSSFLISHSHRSLHLPSFDILHCGAQV